MTVRQPPGFFQLTMDSCLLVSLVDKLTVTVTSDGPGWKSDYCARAHCPNSGFPRVLGVNRVAFDKGLGCGPW